MNDKHSRLGRGLDQLIPAAREGQLTPAVVADAGHRIAAVALDKLRANPWQPRKEFPLEELNALIDSLQHQGLMQPIVVRPHAGGYQVIAGERRWRAAVELGWKTIDAVVVDADDRKMLEWALVENILRQNLGPLEIAEGLQRLMQSTEVSQEEAGKRLAMSRAAVANHLRLLELPNSIKLLVSQTRVSMGAARALLAIKDRRVQEDAAGKVARGLLTVRQVEALAAGKMEMTSRKLDPNLKVVAEEIQSLLGTRVQIRGKLDRGLLVVSYGSRKQLDGLLRLLRRLESNEAMAAESGRIKI